MFFRKLIFKSNKVSDKLARIAFAYDRRYLDKISFNELDWSYLDHFHYKVFHFIYNIAVLFSED